MERLGTDRSTEITHFPHMRKLRRGRNEREEKEGGVLSPTMRSEVQIHGFILYVWKQKRDGVAQELRNIGSSVP